jgi:hypothetical protein
MRFVLFINFTNINLDVAVSMTIRGYLDRPKKQTMRIYCMSKSLSGKYTIDIKGMINNTAARYKYREIKV